MLSRYIRTLDVDVIIHAIEITGFAPRPSKHYLAAILHRYLCQGITDIEKVFADEDRHRQLRESNQRIRTAKWYDTEMGLEPADVMRLDEYNIQRYIEIEHDRQDRFEDDIHAHPEKRFW